MTKLDGFIATRTRLSWLRHVPVGGYLLAFLLTAVVLVQGWNIGNYPALGDDEGTYLAQAWAVAAGDGLAHYTYWYDHPPLGWIQLALFAWLPPLLRPDGLAVASGRLLMLAVSVVNATLVYSVTRRLSYSRWGASLAVLLFALSPLSVGLHRQIYLDNLAVTWILASFVLALSFRRHLWSYVGAGSCAAIAVLSKETVVIVLPAVVFALWRSSDPSTRKFALVGFTCGLVLIGLFYPLYALLKGELFAGDDHVSLIGALLFQVNGRSGSGSIFAAGSGANQLLHSWLYYDQVLLIGGVTAVVIGLLLRRARPVAVAGALLVLMAMRPGGYLPAMYVVQALPFFAISLAVVSETFAQWLLARRWGMPVVALCLVAAMVVVVPGWYEGDRRAMTVDANANSVAAVGWVRDHVSDPAHTRIVVDDALWLDMVRAGCQPGLGAIWFYKLDLDPAVRQELPNGWRDLNYVVSTPILRENPGALPTLSAALAHSTVLATFGSGADRVEIRHVEGNSAG